MANNSSETIAVRLPSQIAKELVKLRDQKNLASIGSALQVYIQKMKDDRIQRQIGNLDEKLRNWINTQVDMSSSLALLNFRVAFLQDMFKLRFPLELTEGQREKVLSGESGNAIKFVMDAMRAQKKHYKDTKQTQHSSYKGCLEFFEKAKELAKESPTDEHIT